MSVMDIVGVLGLLVGLAGTGIALYQWGVMSEAKKRRHELQYLLAGVSNMATSKSQAWNNQVSLHLSPEREADAPLIRLMVRARDDFSEIYGLVAALEGAIDSENSASTAILKKTLDQGQINNEIQRVAMENPTLARAASYANGQ